MPPLTLYWYDGDNSSQVCPRPKGLEESRKMPSSGQYIVGEKGTIEINRDKISANPKELVLAANRPEPLKVPETQPHIENWIDCIKTRKRCNADIEYGQRSSTLCYLVNIARDLGRVGETLKWDPKAERFTNSKEGTAMRARPRRKGYALPKRSLFGRTSK